MLIEKRWYDNADRRLEDGEFRTISETYRRIYV